MNERITQLAQQAGFVLWQDESWNPGDVIDWSCRYDDEFKKFAELIVMETMQVVANQLPSNQYLDVADAVLKHFGVEERATNN